MIPFLILVPAQISPDYRTLHSGTLLHPNPFPNPADIVGMQERRMEIRMLSADMVTVWWKDKKGRTQPATGLLEDISRSGACFQLETPVPLGVEIEWKTPKQSFTGRVRYCVYREIGYFVGLEFDSKCRWSKKAYRPQHLLDLGRLMRKIGQADSA